ncbi:MAG: ABC transporter ATP-binding protein [Peptoniphilus sp.]|nr:ABC transporter ATP-binding protein [Peptoniphilus sp.]MDY3119235.1 ABC transporter ATP-binding protein [Peptoniphilus sp.]
MSAIVVSGLTKKFRRNLVFNDFHLEVFDGEIFSIMGMEGTGKTTLARILFHFLKPNKGSVRIFDMDGQRESKSVKEFMSYVPEDVWIYDNLKPMAIFKHTLAFHGLKNTDEIQSLMEYFELDNRHKFADLTDSERKRVAIINAFITKPKLLVLDNPSKDLSRAMLDKLFTHIQRLQSSEGLSVLLLTDDLSIGQRYGDRGAYLSGGRLTGMEYLKDKKNNDKVLRIFDELINVGAFEEIGARLLKDESGDVEFFYDGYLPTLTTVLHQQKVKNYVLEDAILANKVDAVQSNRTSVSHQSAAETAAVEDEGEAMEDTILAYDVDEFNREVSSNAAAEEKAADSAETVILNESSVKEKEAEKQGLEEPAKPTEDAAEIIVASEEKKNTSYDSDAVILDSRKTQPIEPVDAYDVVEEKYNFSPKKEEE